MGAALRGGEQTEGGSGGDRPGAEHTEGVAKIASAKTRTDYEKAVKSLEGTNFNLVSAYVRVFVWMCRCMCIPMCICVYISTQCTLTMITNKHWISHTHITTLSVCLWAVDERE